MKELISSIATLAVRVSGAAVQFAMSWLILQAFGMESVGRFFTGLMIATGIAVVAKRGMDIALVQYIPGQAISNGEQKRILWEVIRRVGLNALVISLGLIGMLWAVAPGTSLHKLEMSAMIGSAIGISLNMVFAEYLKTRGKVIGSGLTQFVSIPLIMCLILAAMNTPALSIEKTYINSPQIYWFILWIIVATIECALSVFSMNANMVSGNCVAHVEKIKAMGFGILGVNVLGFLISWMDISIANLLYDPVVVGQYSMLSKIAMAATFVTVAVTSVYGRRIAHAYNENDMASVRKRYGEARRSGWLLVLPVVGVATAFHREIVQLISPEFIETSWLLVIMVAGQAASLMFGPSNYALIMIERSVALTRVYMVGILVMVVMAVCLKNILGIYAAATGIVLGHIAINAVSYSLVRKWMA